MAAYNGLPYIREQVISILKNLTAEDELIISDDGSTDKTPEFLAELAKDGGLSVRALEQMISEAAEEADKPSDKESVRQKKNSEIIAIEEELKEVLGTKVKLPNSTKKGKIEISFFSREELERLIDLLRSLRI